MRNEGEDSDVIGEKIEDIPGEGEGEVEGEDDDDKLLKEFRREDKDSR